MPFGAGRIAIEGVGGLGAAEVRFRAEGRPARRSRRSRASVPSAGQWTTSTAVSLPRKSRQSPGGAVRPVRSRRPCPAEEPEGPGGAEQAQPKVEPGTHPGDVETVEAQFPAGIRVVSAHPLGQARDPRPHAQPPGKPRRPTFEPRGQFRAFRPRAHQAHLAPQDVDRLGQLVEMEPAQHLPRARHPPVPRRGQYGPGAVLRVFHHGPELEDGEHPAAAAQAGLAVEHPPAVLQPDGQRDNGAEQSPQRQQRQQEKTENGEVEGALVALPCREGRILPGMPCMNARRAAADRTARRRALRPGMRFDRRPDGPMANAHGSLRPRIRPVFPLPSSGFFNFFDSFRFPPSTF